MGVMRATNTALLTVLFTLAMSSRPSSGIPNIDHRCQSIDTSRDRALVSCSPSAPDNHKMQEKFAVLRMICNGSAFGEYNSGSLQDEPPTDNRDQSRENRWRVVIPDNEDGKCESPVSLQPGGFRPQDIMCNWECVGFKFVGDTKVVRTSLCNVSTLPGCITDEAGGGRPTELSRVVKASLGLTCRRFWSCSEAGKRNLLCKLTGSENARITHSSAVPVDVNLINANSRSGAKYYELQLAQPVGTVKVCVNASQSDRHAGDQTAGETLKKCFSIFYAQAATAPSFNITVNGNKKRSTAISVAVTQQGSGPVCTRSFKVSVLPFKTMSAERFEEIQRQMSNDRFKRKKASRSGRKSIRVRFKFGSVNDVGGLCWKVKVSVKEAHCPAGVSGIIWTSFSVYQSSQLFGA